MADGKFVAATAFDGLMVGSVDGDAVKLEKFAVEGEGLPEIDKETAQKLCEKYSRQLDKRVLYGTEESDKRREKKLAAGGGEDADDE